MFYNKYRVSILSMALMLAISLSGCQNNENLDSTGEVQPDVNFNLNEQEDYYDNSDFNSVSENIDDTLQTEPQNSLDDLLGNHEDTNTPDTVDNTNTDGTATDDTPIEPRTTDTQDSNDVNNDLQELEALLSNADKPQEQQVEQTEPQEQTQEVMPISEQEQASTQEETQVTTSGSAQTYTQTVTPETPNTGMFN